MSSSLTVQATPDSHDDALYTEIDTVSASMHYRVGTRVFVKMITGAYHELGHLWEPTTPELKQAWGPYYIRVAS
jgi:hypothetical protein